MAVAEAFAGGGVYRAVAVAPCTLRNYHATMSAIPAIRLFLVLALSLLLSALGTAARAQEGPGTGILLQIDGPIGPATSDFLIRGMKDGADSGASLIVIQMDTPGGLVSSTRDIIKAILGSPVPVATFVAPSGSRAASAGTYILYASHIAAPRSSRSARDDDPRRRRHAGLHGRRLATPAGRHARTPRQHAR